MSIGSKIYELRKKQNLSQEGLAEKLEVTRQTISNWECDETIPDLKYANQLAQVFHVSVDYLVGNDCLQPTIEKVSNIEKLAGIIIKLIKYLGIVLIALILIGFISILFFMNNKQTSVTKDGGYSYALLSCRVGENTYDISIGDNGFYDCKGCSDKMNVYLNDITEWPTRDEGVKNIEKYFKENGGSCE
jgi:transcriptional regulator with XRE-family HTH domain